ncbi:DUF488 domain-containing protein [Herbidospora cretacea]|uniref:DUF488 domain-containing protein n=1 Tax=Herbidospora cretacea TaxID=28444 RepID=UPI000774A1DB|nr:DUF488 domain-containing protein [Herbidospora cretacea]
MGLTGVGYEGTDLETFVRCLRDAGVDIIVDVRLNPISRKRGFSKNALAAGLAEAGIGYRHMRALGNPKWNRPGFSGSPEELGQARDLYAGEIRSEEARRCLDEIARLAHESSVALLCFESDERRCHRDVVLGMVGYALLG